MVGARDVLIGVGVAAGAGFLLYYLLTRGAAAAPTRVLTLTASCDGDCISGGTITFSGRLTESGVGVEGETIYVRNETTGEIMGSATTDADGYYEITATLPTVTEDTTYDFRAYTEDQLPS